jgi:hypothetical protein
LNGIARYHFDLQKGNRTRLSAEEIHPEKPWPVLIES